MAREREKARTEAGEKERLRACRADLEASDSDDDGPLWARRPYRLRWGVGSSTGGRHGQYRRLRLLAWCWAHGGKTDSGLRMLETHRPTSCPTVGSMVQRRS